jgi:hypothetical protein
MAIPQSTTRRKMIDAYRLTDSLAGKAYCKVKREPAARWVAQGLARWCKGGEAIQLTEPIAKSSITESAITSSECAANAGAATKDASIADARCKVAAWPLVGVDAAYGKPTRAPLPTEPGGIRKVSHEELEKLSSDTGSVYADSGVFPVDYALRKNSTRMRLPNNDFVQQHYNDDERESLPGLPLDYHDDGVELEA